MQKLSTQQAKAISDIGIWLKNKNQPYITLGGYAGTGKTTVISALRKILSDNQPEMKLAFCAYTGKDVYKRQDRYNGVFLSGPSYPHNRQLPRYNLD